MQEKEFNPEYKLKDDCYLVAYCACFNVSYKEAKATGITSSKDKIIEVLENKGYKYNQVANIWKDSKIELVDFASKHPVGTYYVMLRNKQPNKHGHAIAVIDNVVYDAKKHTNYKDYVVDGYFCINENRASVDNSYLSDMKYLSDYALEYVQKKLEIEPLDEDTYIKVSRKGTNNLTVYINGEEIADINFPFNSTKQENLNIIKKEIDKYKA